MKGFFKKSGIYFDTEVKDGSNNAVTSGAVAKAIQEGGGGGGGGTTDYVDLSNKPKINNVELSGNKTLESLGIASSGDLTALSSRVTQAESSMGDLSDLTTTDKTSLVNAINEVAGGGGGGGGTTDYVDLSNKPKINNVELSGNKTLVSLGIASIGDFETLDNDIQTLTTTVESDIGDLSDLTTTDKTSLVNAINEVAGGGGGSSGGVKYQRFSNKQTNGTTSISGVSYVTFTETNIKSWFDTAPTNIHAIIASKSGGSVVKVALKTGASFITEQASNAVTYDFVGVFYE